MIIKYMIIKYRVDLEDINDVLSYSEDDEALCDYLDSYVYNLNTYTYMEAPHFEFVSLVVF